MSVVPHSSPVSGRRTPHTRSPRRTRRPAIALTAAAAAISLALAGCSSGTTQPAADADSVTVRNQWIKAADTGMSAAFAEFSNSGDREVRIVDATGPAAARMEIHEVVAADGGTMMRPKAGGLVIAPHSTVKLTPGGDHLMFIDLKAPLRTGAQSPITVKFADGSSTTFTSQVRDFAGNQENYAPSGDAQAPKHGG
ncbi:copper chaperone PCu(A)C [Nocardia sp. NPDC052254]|uniref:copper chaperone PCu(A)C n=1 Tax=Nocardia sp. NPDC052254 TaxID=3155681 RepID=UPI00343768FC